MLSVGSDGRLACRSFTDEIDRRAARRYKK